MIRTLARPLALVLIAASTAAAQTSPRVFTAADYNRASMMLGQNLGGLVVGGSAQANWLSRLARVGGQHELQLVGAVSRHLGRDRVVAHDQRARRRHQA